MDACRSVGSDSGRSKWRALAKCTNTRPAYLDDVRGTGGAWVQVAGRTFRCCPGCAVRQGWAVRELIRRGLLALPEGTFVGFLTITEGADARSLSDHGAAVSRFLGDLFRLFGASRAGEHPYIGVRELQVRGAWHSHLLVANWRRCDLEEVRRLLVKHGLGWRFNVKTYRMGHTDAVDSLATYLAKSFGRYFTKGARDQESWSGLVEAMPRGSQLVVQSRSWAGGQTRGSVERERLAAYRARVSSPGLAEWVPIESVISEALRSMGILAVEPDPPPEQLALL